MTEPRVRDILYFDFEKASSIWSQFQWGQLEKFSIASEELTDAKINAGVGIPNIAEVKLNVGEGEKRTILETKILHHDLLNRIESFLSSIGLVVNLNKEVVAGEETIESIHEILQDKPYIIASGSSVIEDYQRILLISEKFNDLSKFIGTSAMENIKKSSEYQQIEATIDEKKKALKLIKDPNEKAKAKAQITALAKTIDQMLQSQISGVDQWILDGIKLWISTFMPNRINFRVYPFPSCPSFQVLCNLKRDSFVDQDIEHLLYGYGTKPNLPLSIFGLITSIPLKSGSSFDPLSEFEGITNLSNEMVFEKAFRGMFGALEGLENFVKYSRYPNITVHPIAVFRSFSLKNAHQVAA